MWENVIGLHIRKCNRRLLLVNGVMLGALLACALAGQRYLYNCWKGPFPTTAEEVAQAGNPENSQRYFVALDQLKPLKAGLQRTETEHGVTKVTATFFAVPAGKKFLLIQSPDTTAAASYQGALIPMPADVRSHFQDKVLDSKHLRFDDVFEPYLLDTGSFRDAAYICFGLGIPLGLLALYNVAKAVRRMGDMESSPIARSLSNRFRQPAANVAMAIDQDVKANGGATPQSPLIFGTNWMLRPSFYGMDVLHRDEIIWVYQKVTSHSVNFVPTGKTYSLIIGDDRGRRIEVPAGRSKEQVEQLIRTLLTRFPWVVAGYSEQRKSEYDKNRAAFVDAVHQRQAAYTHVTA